MSSIPDMAAHKSISVSRARTLAYLLALLVAGSISVLLAAKPAHAATFTVNRTSDAGDRNINDSVCDTSSASGRQCTLRAAIQEANDTTGADTINFNIVSSASVKTISPASALPTIRQSVTIDGYSQPGAHANTLTEGNDAVLLIELNGTGAGAAADGLRITGANSTIRGLVINRFKENGVLIAGSGATGNRVEGNFIGTDAAGSADQGNTLSGVFIDGARSNTVGGTDADDGTVDGVVEARNVISGNNQDGVVIFRVSARGNKVQGNHIGTGASGTQTLGNRDFGVFISSATNTTIGGTDSGAGNTITHHGLEGVLIGGDATGNKVQGNSITSNRNGVDIEDVPDNANNLIGGRASGAGNVISDNGGSGVTISGTGATGNSILSNRIFENNGLGIDLLGEPGVTANDEDDLDTGANNLQNFPVITSATQVPILPFGFGITITGTLNSNPNQDFTVQCFVAEDPADASGHGEGQGFVAEDSDVRTDTNGDASFECKFFFLASLEGRRVSTTATNEATRNTSEFSENVAIGSGS